MTILVVGEAIVDVIHRGSQVVRRPGGSPTNVAVGLARLGHPVFELTYLGNDSDGQLLRDHLRAAGVRELYGALTAPASSVADIRIDAAGDAKYDFSIQWDVPTSIDWTGIELVHVGSIAIAVNPGAEHLLTLLRNRPTGIRVTVDPNIRSAFLPPTGVTAHLERFFELADVIKLSDDDASALYPGMAPEALLDVLFEFGPSIVALTRGPEGALLAARDALAEVSAVPTVVADTVGAGDSFMAALISAVVESGNWSPRTEELRAFGELAVRAAAFTVSRSGAVLPSMADL
ncbi:MAG: fructokinase [Actinomycetota bacterium]|jgi:fructokinase|nr:fructokinase [Actinomycetota bacterium]